MSAAEAGEHADATAGDLVLVVEDDRKTAALVATYLHRDGFRTLLVHDGRLAVEAARRERPRFVILDLMLPGADGWEICRGIRKTSDVPILFLTARDDEADRVLGLSLGGDDYVVKPFSPRELVARVRAILRRARPADAEGGVLAHEGLTLDLDKRRVAIDGRPATLTPSEYVLLQALMSAPGRVFLREELLCRLYPRGESVVDRVIDVHIGKLRQKIEADPADPRYVVTVRGVGYRFADRTGIGASWPVVSAAGCSGSWCSSTSCRSASRSRRSGRRCMSWRRGTSSRSSRSTRSRRARRTPCSWRRSGATCSPRG